MNIQNYEVFKEYTTAKSQIKYLAEIDDNDINHINSLLYINNSLTKMIKEIHRENECTIINTNNPKIKKLIFNLTNEIELKIDRIFFDLNSFYKYDQMNNFKNLLHDELNNETYRNEIKKSINKTIYTIMDVLNNELIELAHQLKQKY